MDPIDAEHRLRVGLRARELAMERARAAADAQARREAQLRERAAARRIEEALREIGTAEGFERPSFEPASFRFRR